MPPAEIRDLMSYGEAYAPLADELEALAQFIRHSIAAARHAAGTEALTTYALARRLAKQAKNAGLAPYVTDMRRALGRVRPPRAVRGHVFELPDRHLRASPPASAGEGRAEATR